MPKTTRRVRAAASFELLHAFALLQDDVMDAAPFGGAVCPPTCSSRGGIANAALAGSAERFGESAAVLLGDLCLVWAEQMLRDSGVDDTALSRAWPRYDAMRTELAVGQFADLVNDACDCPPWTRCWMFRDASPAITRCGGRWKSEPRWRDAVTAC